jgi:hypothetical protein
MRNGISVSIASLISLFGGRGSEHSQSDLLTEIGNHLVQENGGFILLEQ